MQNNTFVLDVNIWLSLFFRDQYKDFFLLAVGSIFYRSEAMTQELSKKIVHPKISKRLISKSDVYIHFYEDITTLFNPIPIFTDCPDPDDNYLFDLAIQSQADYLVTGDKTVLDTPINPPTKIITFAEFREMFV